jgi:hypothetical protein
VLINERSEVTVNGECSGSWEGRREKGWCSFSEYAMKAFTLAD